LWLDEKEHENPSWGDTIQAEYDVMETIIVADNYRGTRLNYDMLMSIMSELKAGYDFIFIPVLHRLGTHQYWQRWGATEFYRDSECVCYILKICHKDSSSPYGIY